MGSSTKDLLALSEGILNGTSPAKEITPIGADPVIVDDLKGITVPDSFIENIVNFSGKLDEGSVATFEEKPVEFLKEANLSEQKITSLVERLKLLIQEAREVMTEMTTSGMIGSGIQRNLLKKKKKRKT